MPLAAFVNILFTTCGSATCGHIRKGSKFFFFCHLRLCHLRPHHWWINHFPTFIIFYSWASNPEWNFPKLATDTNQYKEGLSYHKNNSNSILENKLDQSSDITSCKTKNESQIYQLYSQTKRERTNPYYNLRTKATVALCMQFDDSCSAVQSKLKNNY